MEEPGFSAGILLDRWRSGDTEVFRQVLQRFQAPLLAYVLQMLRNIHDAEDSVQEAFLRAHRSVHQLRDPEKLWEWLKRIAYNAAMDSLQHARRRGIPTDPAVIQEIGDEQQSRSSDDTKDTETESPSLQMMVDAIEHLPELYREVAVYRFLQEWPYDRIAAALALEPATVRQRISRACRMLREALNNKNV